MIDRTDRPSASGRPLPVVVVGGGLINVTVPQARRVVNEQAPAPATDARHTSRSHEMSS
jgi:hypothetical protein